MFARLKTSLNENLEGVGCPAHVLHNTMQTAADVLSTDVEVIVVKLFSYFCIYTVRTEHLKDFCKFVGVEYHVILSHFRNSVAFIRTCSGQNTETV